MNHCLGVSVVLLACLVVTAYSQTFQYSRGWTNGKRRVPEVPMVGMPVRISNEHRVLEDVLSKFVSTPPASFQHMEVLDVLHPEAYLTASPSLCRSTFHKNIPGAQWLD